MSDNQNPLSFGDIYGIIGAEGFQRLIAAFYRQVAEDDILRPMYPERDLEPAERRLRQFLEQYFGGPTTYSDKRGHPRLRMRHARFRIDKPARDRWMQLMNNALDEANFPAEVQAIMQEYFEQAASFMINTYPTNDDQLAIQPQPPQTED